MQNVELRYTGICCSIKSNKNINISPTIKNFMSSNYTTPQEEFWASQFGNEYISRNKGELPIASNTKLFAQIISRTRNVESIIEFGSNIGLNLHALRNLLPSANLSAIEINFNACEQLRSNTELNLTEIFQGSILDITFSNSQVIPPPPHLSCSPILSHQYDFVLIKGVLIHINPDMLHKVYENLYKVSGKYICICEYYNPVPVTINYRGHNDRLFKRDFAGEVMDKFPDLKLVDYGFVWKRDNNFPQDDTTWFLLEK
jgi:spore coat polysaccharide biosynthesis protein SpsF